MNSDIRLSVGFWQHPKTFRLEKTLGLKGIRSLQILWCWCAQNRPDGDLADLAADEIEFVADWRGRKGVFVEACICCGWLDKNPGFSLHEWAEYNPYQAKGMEREQARKEKAQKAANARWNKFAQADASICPDNAQAYANTNSSICSNDAQAYAQADASICPDDAQAYANTNSSICSNDAQAYAQAMPSLTLTSTSIKENLKENPLTPLQGEVAVFENPKPPEKSSGKRRRGDNGKLALQAVMTAYTGDVALLQALEEYRQMRERIRKPLTCKALEIGLRELDRLAVAVPEKIAIVEQSIFKGWQGFFPLDVHARDRPLAPTEWQKGRQEQREMAAMILKSRLGKGGENGTAAGGIALNG